MKQQTFSNKKWAWLKKVEKAEHDILEMTNKSVRGDFSKSTLQLRKVNQELIKLGQRGEYICEQAIQMHRNKRVIDELANAVNIIELLTDGVRQLAESKFQGAVLPMFPTFKTHLAASEELVTQSKAVGELAKMARGDDDE